MEGLDELMVRLEAGEARALARAISLVESGGSVAAQVEARCRARVRERAAGGEPRALRLGMTGAGGVGKSSLVDRLVRLLREEGTTVGVVAVDPTSPYTGGALLGDRIRMQGFSGDGGVTIRSMATRGTVGGVAGGVEAACVAMEAAGRQVVVIETVGVGQGEVAVAGMVDVVVLVLAPGLGDEVQAMKAGVMEAADVLVVNQSDREGAEELEAALVGMQGLSAGAATIPVMQTVATTGAGVGALLATVRQIAGAQREKRGVPEATSVVDHVAIAVRDLEAARRLYALLGLSGSEVETIEHEAVRVLMLGEGAGRVELLQGLSDDSSVARFVARRGEGVHHLALRTADVDELFARLRSAGLRIVSDAVRVGAGGHRYFFVHPESTGGVLIEMVGEAAR